MSDAAREYESRYHSVLQRVASNLEAHLQECTASCSHIDRVSARAKSPDRFAEKAAKKNPNGTPKYKAPLEQIQDQLGARVIVFYKDDVQKVTEVVKRYFAAIEQKELVPESEWAFGYFGLHFVMALPRDVVPIEADPSRVPRFFELQIKTLFQHAWSEANHDLGYKPSEELSSDQQRRFAYTAAQAWGADRVFEELRAELSPSRE
jgi:putative GTP pyrophosphokinase